MQQNFFINQIFKFIAFLFLSFLSINSSIACTRVIYAAPQNTILTGRSMDWSVDVQANIWAFPKGLKRSGAAGANSIQWTSKFGSIVTTFYDIATVDGINEKGLTANVLYLAESIYPTPTKDDTRQPLSIAAWAQFVLDNYSTVSEVVNSLKKEPFYIVQVTTPDGHPGVGHLSVSDPSGDSAIFEYIDGKLVIHHDPKYQVMTNSPTFDEQLAINQYWQDIGGETMLPGTSRPADRFVRAAYYLDIAPKTTERLKSTVEVLAIMNNVSAPFGTSSPGKPNIAATLWRTISDQKNLIYYFNSTSTPNIFWLELKDINFSQNQPTLKLSISQGEIYTGNAIESLKTAEPFKFLEAI